MNPLCLARTTLYGAFLALIAPGVGLGQSTPSGGPPDVNKLAHDLAGRVRHLGEDIVSEMGQNPAARHIIEDVQEMAQAVDEFHETIHDQHDPNAIARTFSGIDQTWQHLRNQITTIPIRPDAVNRAVNNVDWGVVAVRQALNLNQPPAAFYGNGPAPSGIADTQRLAHALVSRAQGLAWAIQSSMSGDPNGAALAQDANALIQAADTFHDTIDTNQPIQVAAQAFAPVDQIADRVERFATSGRVPNQVEHAWQAVAAVEVLIHQNLGLGSPQPAVQYSLAPPANGPSPIVPMSGQLVEQVQAYVNSFASMAKGEREGLAAIGDAQRLLAAASLFRQNAAQGLPPNQLAHEFRDVDATWQRLVRRAERIAHGRNGPYVQQVRAIGGTCEQIHRVLGMVGYPPNPYANAVGDPPPPPPGSGQFR